MSIIAQLKGDQAGAPLNPYFEQPEALAPQTKARSVDINALSDAVRAAFDRIPVVSQSWKGVQDYSGGTLRVGTPIGMRDAVTKAYVDALAFKAGGMPSNPQPGTYYLAAVDGVLDWHPESEVAADPDKAIEEMHAAILSF